MASRTAVYLDVLDQVREVGREHGYAIGLHGSLKRDLDLIAAPWTEEATDAQALIDAICTRLDVFPSPRVLPSGETCPRPRPHGRLGWALVNGELAPGYIDISVMPRTAA